ncbi:MAG: SDR family oxidoreductase [Pseudomonadota bacterium]
MTEIDLSLELAPRVIAQDLAELTERVPVDRRNLFIFGLGYTGRYIGQKLAALGWRISGTSRDPETRQHVQANGINAFDFSILSSDDVRQYDNILVTIGPDRSRGDDPTLISHGDLLGSGKPRWLGYFSATSVYGAVDGWIDEASPTEPTTERGKRRLKIEQDWTSWAKQHGIPLSLLRLAGIYGPGRNILEQLTAGTARVVEKPGHVFNRIHVEDIARATVFDLAQAAPYSVRNLADGEPLSQQDWTAKAAKLLKIEPPAPIPFEKAKVNMSPMGLSFWSESRKIAAPRF